MKGAIKKADSGRVIDIRLNSLGPLAFQFALLSHGEAPACPAVEN